MAALLGGVMAAGTDWPVYRHDVQLTGVSVGKGQIIRPQVRWEHYLGAPVATITTCMHPR